MYTSIYIYIYFSITPGFHDDSTFCRISTGSATYPCCSLWTYYKKHGWLNGYSDGSSRWACEVENTQSVSPAREMGLSCIFIQLHRINVGQQKLQMHAQAQCFCHRGLEQKQNLLPMASSLTCVHLQMRHGKMQSCRNEALNSEGTLYWQQYKKNA